MTEPVILRFEDETMLNVAFPATRGEHGYLEIVIPAGMWRANALFTGDEVCEKLAEDLRQADLPEGDFVMSRNPYGEMAAALVEKGWRR